MDCGMAWRDGPASVCNVSEADEHMQRPGHEAVLNKAAAH